MAKYEGMSLVLTMLAPKLWFILVMEWKAIKNGDIFLMSVQFFTYKILIQLFINKILVK